MTQPRDNNGRFASNKGKSKKVVVKKVINKKAKINPNVLPDFDTIGYSYNWDARIVREDSELKLAVGCKRISRADVYAFERVLEAISYDDDDGREDFAILTNPDSRNKLITLTKKAINYFDNNPE